MKKLITEKEEFEEDYKNEVGKVPKEFGEKNAKAMGGIMAIFKLLEKGEN